MMPIRVRYARTELTEAEPEIMHDESVVDLAQEARSDP